MRVRRKNNDTSIWMRLAGHGLGSALMALGLAWWLLDLNSLSLVLESVQAGVLAGRTMLSVLAHLGMSAALWAIIYGVGRRIFGRGGDRGKGERPRLFRTSFSDTFRIGASAQLKTSPRSGERHSVRGAVITETLIAMPVALLLIFGLAQLSINNVAGVMVNAAMFETSRAAWMWLPETHAERMGGVSLEQVEDKARIQAALVIMPVAPGEYGLRTELSESAEQARGMVVASQMTMLNDDVGADGMALAQLLELGWLTNHSDTSLSTSLDSSRFLVRSIKKFDAAYATTRVKVEEFDQGDIPMMRVTVTYRHLSTMPLVMRIFGEPGFANPDTPGDRPGYYTEIKRVFERKRQDAPRIEWPEGGA